MSAKSRPHHGGGAAERRGLKRHHVLLVIVALVLLVGWVAWNVLLVRSDVGGAALEAEQAAPPPASR